MFICRFGAGQAPSLSKGLPTEGISHRTKFRKRITKADHACIAIRSSECASAAKRHVATSWLHAVWRLHEVADGAHDEQHVSRLTLALTWVCEARSVAGVASSSRRSPSFAASSRTVTHRNHRQYGHACACLAGYFLEAPSQSRGRMNEHGDHACAQMYFCGSIAWFPGSRRNEGVSESAPSQCASRRLLFFIAAKLWFLIQA